MTKLTSKTALFMLLFVPCRAFGSVSDVAADIIALPMNAVKSVCTMALEMVDGVAKIEESVFDTVTALPMEGAKRVVSMANDHSQTIWRAASVATLAYAFRYAKQAYVKNCAMNCKK